MGEDKQLKSHIWYESHKEEIIAAYHRAESVYAAERVCNIPHGVLGRILDRWGVRSLNRRNKEGDSMEQQTNQPTASSSAAAADNRIVVGALREAIKQCTTAGEFRLFLCGMIAVLGKE